MDVRATWAPWDSAKVELGRGSRKNDPISLAVGPARYGSLVEGDRVSALLGRAEVKDYFDLYVSLGRYTEDELLDLAAHQDPGFDRSRFAEALSAIDRLPDRLFQPYSRSPEITSALKARMRAWAHRIRTSS